MTLPSPADRRDILTMVDAVLRDFSPGPVALRRLEHARRLTLSAEAAAGRGDVAGYFAAIRLVSRQIRQVKRALQS